MTRGQSREYHEAASGLALSRKQLKTRISIEALAVMDGSPATASRQAPPCRGERLALLGFVAVFVVFGALVEYRSAFQRTRKGDLDVFLRAAGPSAPTPIPTR